MFTKHIHTNSNGAFNYFKEYIFQFNTQCIHEGSRNHFIILYCWFFRNNIIIIWNIFLRNIFISFLPFYFRSILFNFKLHFEMEMIWNKSVLSLLHGIFDLRQIMPNEKNDFPKWKKKGSKFHKNYYYGNKNVTRKIMICSWIHLDSCSILIENSILMMFKWNLIMKTVLREPQQNRSFYLIFHIYFFSASKFQLFQSFDQTWRFYICNASI